MVVICIANERALARITFKMTFLDNDLNLRMACFGANNWPAQQWNRLEREPAY
jgi:hypothetical protein